MAPDSTIAGTPPAAEQQPPTPDIPTQAPVPSESAGVQTAAGAPSEQPGAPEGAPAPAEPPAGETPGVEADSPEETQNAPEGPTDAPEAPDTTPAPARATGVAPNGDVFDGDAEHPATNSFCRVVAGLHQGRYGVLQSTASIGADGWPDQVVVRTRDAEDENIVVAYSDIRPDVAGRR